MRTHRGISRIIVLLVVVLVVIIAVAVYYIASQPSSPPPSPPQSVKITRFSLDSLDMREGENTTLTVVIENINKTTKHQIEYRFNVSRMVLIYEGIELLNRVNSYYNFSFQLGTAEPSRTLQFTVTGTLHGEVQFSGYSLALSVYVDGEELQKTWEDLTLIIREK